MFGTYIGNNKMLVKLAYNGMLNISSEDLSLMPSLVTTGIIEAPLTKFFINQIKPGNIVIDIGTNVGYFTILAAKLVGTQGKVFGFEANPEVFELLKDNISMNWLSEQTKLYNIAIYSKNKNLTFHSSDRFHGDSSINIRPEDENRTDPYTLLNIKANTLDNQFQHLKQIDLIKIDIEGGEYHAFLGMMELIKQHKINQIVFEWNKIMLGTDCDDFVALLNKIKEKYNGMYYLLDSEGNPVPTTLDAITPVDFYPFVLLKFSTR
ncbi:FkbM family methyltransferase [Bacillus manliponensis]|uniref:FkbM family methyltransferase n=1 Tax=Bacillus manliponensis TaxID=574376 RepID=UPI0035149D7D